MSPAGYRGGARVLDWGGRTVRWGSGWHVMRTSWIGFLVTTWLAGGACSPSSEQSQTTDMRADGGGGSPALSQCPPSMPPADVQPRPPTATVAESCQLAAETTTQWTFPVSSVDTDQSGLLVGRWVICETFAPGVAVDTGIEFGGDGRFRTLTNDPSGALVPVVGGDHGCYDLHGTGQNGYGQLDLIPEGSGGRTSTFRLSFAPGMDAHRSVNGDLTVSIYARSPLSSTTTAQGDAATSTGPSP